MTNVPAFGLRGYLIDAPTFGSLRSWRDGALVIENGRICETGDCDTLGKARREASQFFDEVARRGTTNIGVFTAIYADSSEAAFRAATVFHIASLLPYRKLLRSGSDGSAEDLLTFCVYRGNAANTLETFVRGRSIYRAPEPPLF